MLFLPGSQSYLIADEFMLQGSRKINGNMVDRCFHLIGKFVVKFVKFVVKSHLFQVRKLSNNLSEMKVEQMVGNLKLKEPGKILFLC